MADEHDDECDGHDHPPLPPLTQRMEFLIHDAPKHGREVVEFMVCPLTWLDLCEELCPEARMLTDIQTIKWRGIPVRKNLHPQGEEGILYFDVRLLKPKDMVKVG